MKKHKKAMPTFQSEDAERDFWARHDSTDYIDWSRAKRAVFPNLRPSTQTISIRLPELLLARIKQAAHRRDVPYQSYIKIVLEEEFEPKDRRVVS